uniref:Putative ovule protein n=1 Tax=Solanum chacoense TaxID=4108 RepID=A0A0V0IP25_SOLCH
MESHENGLLKRCLVGHLEGGNKEKRTLSEVRRWSSLLWKKAFGVNIYEMYGGKFSLNSPTGTWQNKPYKGKWNWKNQRFNLEWWFPLVGCTPNNILTKETWVRIIGIPLHLWSSQVFQEIGNLCGGWVATEEETELKNHMMVGRILVENDGRNIPREVSIPRYGVVYHFPIRAESHVRFEVLPKLGKVILEKKTREVQSPLYPEVHRLQSLQKGYSIPYFKGFPSWRTCGWILAHS